MKCYWPTQCLAKLLAHTVSGNTIGTHSFWQHYWLTQFPAIVLAHTVSGNTIGPHSFWQHYWLTQFPATLLSHTISSIATQFSAMLYGTVQCIVCNWPKPFFCCFTYTHLSSVSDPDPDAGPSKKLK